MAIVTRYFTTPAATWVVSTAYVVGDYVLGTDNLNYRCILGHTATAGDRPITGGSYTTYWEVCDGTTWNKRANLLPAGNWSAVITGHDFAADSLVCLIEGGLTYTCSQTIDNTTITTDPIAACPLILHGCDSSGVALVPPDPDWTSDQPAWSTSTLPIIATTTNIATIDQTFAAARLVAFTASGRTFGEVLAVGLYGDWISVVNSTSNTNTGGVSASWARLSNSVISMTGSSYIRAYGHAGNVISNTRLIGVTGSSGNRHGIEFAGSGTNNRINGVTVYGFGGDGFNATTTNPAHFAALRNCVIINNAGTGIKTHATASQTGVYNIENCLVANNGAYGIDAQSASRVVMVNVRARDNTSGNFNGFGNYPTDLYNYTTDASDADDFVDAGTGDYRIKNTAAIWGRSVGVSDQPAAGGGTTRGYIIGG